VNAGQTFLDVIKRAVNSIFHLDRSVKADPTTLFPPPPTARPPATTAVTAGIPARLGVFALGRSIKDDPMQDVQHLASGGRQLFRVLPQEDVWILNR